MPIHTLLAAIAGVSFNNPIRIDPGRTVENPAAGLHGCTRSWTGQYFRQRVYYGMLHFLESGIRRLFSLTHRVAVHLISLVRRPEKSGGGSFNWLPKAVAPTRRTRNCLNVYYKCLSRYAQRILIPLGGMHLWAVILDPAPKSAAVSAL